MRVFCQCKAFAFICKEINLDYISTDLLCSCTDPFCGHSFVNSIVYKKELKRSLFQNGIGAIFYNGRFKCGCGEHSVITKTNRLSVECADIYCKCKNPLCGHSFVMSSYYSHTLSPSAKTTSQMAFELCKALPPETRQQLKQQLSML
ncbi:transcriptional regulator [Vibrio vulnificus]|nr:ogr/Delta-like zinc finger family protein [Vibrio vulnificus]QMV36577.1 transcriptional regulator [Vibrio vulnificus]HAT8540523.1 transcriptional regulator [Vibrio vulnificus]HDY8082685.1 ogr/Delta-like zinc finger family protein [Vibrio vulnificus]